MSKQGRERKIGRAVTGGGCILSILSVLMVIFVLGLVACGSSSSSGGTSTDTVQNPHGFSDAFTKQSHDALTIIDEYISKQDSTIEDRLGKVLDDMGYEYENLDEDAKTDANLALSIVFLIKTQIHDSAPLSEIKAQRNDLADLLKG